MWYQYCRRRPLLFCMWIKEIAELWSERWERLYRVLFQKRFQVWVDLVQLDIRHKIKMSLRTLKRRLKELGLNKSHAAASAAVIKQIREKDIESPSMLHGYRRMWNKLRTIYNIIELKPYRFPMHGCIDGFSRKIIWLKACRTNNDPRIPASFYIQTEQHFKYFPSKVQTDCGTENAILAALQCALVGSADTHRYGCSPSNQRIENWTINPYIWHG